MLLKVPPFGTVTVFCVPLPSIKGWLSLVSEQIGMVFPDFLIFLQILPEETVARILAPHIRHIRRRTSS